MTLCKNPIIPGFAPDPSVCRAGEDYYLVNSTFAYFPGVPVFRSRDLASWEQIGNVLERSSQAMLAGCGHSEGIFAPTIRYFRGTFYVITTNVSGGGNFLVTAKDPAGPWSEPHFLGDAAQGIDPSLFFDEDGACYYIGQRESSAGSRYFGDCEIWIQRFDLERMKLAGGAVPVLRGFQRRAVWPEGPHLYRKDGYYYILHAEGGTEFHHCVVAARSRSVFGPYEYCPRNPILTHRHLGKDYPVTCVGHGDLVDDGHGNWYMTALGCRPQDGCTLMGRETFLARVVWEDGWPVVNPGVGRLEEYVELPGGVSQAGGQLHTSGETYRFAGQKLPLQFVALRNPARGTFSLAERPGWLRLHMRPETLRETASPAYLGLRQRHRDYVTEAVFEPEFRTEGDCVGLALVQSNENHIRVECFRDAAELSGAGLRLCVTACVKGRDVLLAQRTIRLAGAGAQEAERQPGGRPGPREICLRIEVHGLSADICWRAQEGWETLASGIGLCYLSTEEAGGFVGCTAGMYASSNGRPGGGYADFSVFRYCPVEELPNDE